MPILPNERKALSMLKDLLEKNTTFEIFESMDPKSREVILQNLM